MYPGAGYLAGQAASSPHLTQEGCMGNIRGNLTSATDIKQALTTCSAGNRTGHETLKCHVAQNWAC